MNFSEKNDFVVKHADGNEFYSDLELFKEHCPNDRLNRDLARANSITFNRLDGSMLLRLLDKVTPDEILSNRVAVKKAEKQRLKNEQKAAEERKRLAEIAAAEQEKEILAAAAAAAALDQQRLEQEAEAERQRLEKEAENEENGKEGEQEAGEGEQSPPSPPSPSDKNKKKD
jgi:hypothetical protein